MTTRHPTRLIAIVGGSGSGKTWLADRLQQAWGGPAARLSLDDFYRDRSNLSPARRTAVNYDHPRAIDWQLVEQVLRDCRAGRLTRLPHYCFASHTRLHEQEQWMPMPVILMDGLWLLWRPSVRELFDVRVFLTCPTQLRLERRVARDIAERGRSSESVRDQFWKTVVPMHDRYVAPQAGWADIVVTQPPSEEEIERLLELLRAPAFPAGRDVHHRAPTPLWMSHPSSEILAQLTPTT
jgi:uridine kinase